MPAARYWRLTAIETYDYGDLELSEIALYDGATRVDASATISSAVAPTSGALAALSDVDFGTTVRWAVNPFAIVWDFGSAQNVDKVGVAGPVRARFAHRFVLQQSSDAVAWVNEVVTQGTQWVNAATIVTKVAVDDGVADPTPLRLGLPAANATIVEAPILDFDQYSASDVRGYYDQEDGGNFRIVGTVKEVALPTNTPLSRKVRLAYEDNGRVIREVFSDAAGNYVFDHIRGDRPYIVTALDYARIYRPVAADQIFAEAYP